MSQIPNAAKRAAAISLLNDLIDELEHPGRPRWFSGELAVKLIWEHGRIIDVKAFPTEQVDPSPPPNGPRSILEFRNAG